MTGPMDMQWPQEEQERSSSSSSGSGTGILQESRIDTERFCDWLSIKRKCCLFRNFQWYY